MVDNEYMSEDHWLCRSLITLGFRIHVDTSVMTTHAGTHMWDARRAPS